MKQMSNLRMFRLLKVIGVRTSRHGFNIGEAFKKVGLEL